MRDPIPKIAMAERAGVVAQVVKHQFSKHKALNSNPSTTTKKVK
jgi:hypothetical protein